MMSCHRRMMIIGAKESEGTDELAKEEDEMPID